MENIIEESFRLELLFMGYLTVILAIAAVKMAFLTAIYFSWLLEGNFRRILRSHLVVGLIACVCAVTLLFGQSLTHHEENARLVSAAVARDDYSVSRIWGIESLVIIYPSRQPQLLNDGIFLSVTSSDEMIAAIKGSHDVSGGF